MANIVIFGASRGVGLGSSIGLSDPGGTVFLVSRPRPSSLERSDQVSRIWICLRQLTRVSCVKEIDTPAMPNLYA